MARTTKEKAARPRPFGPYDPADLGPLVHYGDLVQDLVDSYRLELDQAHRELAANAVELADAHTDAGAWQFRAMDAERRLKEIENVQSVSPRSAELVMAVRKIEDLESQLKNLRAENQRLSCDGAARKHVPRSVTFVRPRPLATAEDVRWLGNG